MRVETAPITSITPYARNPRKNAAGVAKVAASLKEFGWRQPIVVDTDRVIIVGHTRHLAALQLGLTDVPIHVAEGLTPAQIKAYRIADNRAGEESGWDADLLALEVDDLRSMDADLNVLGFDVGELDRVMAGTVAAVDTDTALDRVPDGEKPPFEEITFTLHTSQAVIVREALAAAKAMDSFDGAPNENSNGNALARIAEVALGVLR